VGFRAESHTLTPADFHFWTNTICSSAFIRSMADTDDPVVASYDVVLTQSPALSTAHSVTPSSSPSRVLVLQYPAIRASSRPYNAARSQKPSDLRLKPHTGLLEVDVPILTHEHYNADSGARYGKSVSESRALHGNASHGLAGGFHTHSAQSTSLCDVPLYEDAETSTHRLETQTLGGKITAPSERDPIYFLASLRKNALYLSHLDGVVQMRPELHHLDAEEEMNQKRFQVASTAAGAKLKAAPEPGLSKLESKAIEIKLKDSKDEARDRTLNENARLLRDIQIDTWRSHRWIDQDHAASQAARDRFLANKAHDEVAQSDTQANQLRSALSNGDWLDKMSAPREDGKKGLLAKLRGRERERARRKKAEEEKRMKSKTAGTTSNQGTGPLMEQSSDSDLSSPDATDVELDKDVDDNRGDGLDVEMEDAIEIKKEASGQDIGTLKPQSAPSLSSKPVKRRGRPRKAQPADAVDVED
jgi:RPC5 protein